MQSIATLLLVTSLVLISLTGPASAEIKGADNEPTILESHDVGIAVDRCAIPDHCCADKQCIAVAHVATQLLAHPLDLFGARATDIPDTVCCVLAEHEKSVRR